MKNLAPVAVRSEGTAVEIATVRDGAAPRAALKVRSGVRGGDVYMHNPPGSNTRLNGR